MSVPSARQAIRRINQCGGLSRSPNAQRSSVQPVCRNCTSASATVGSRKLPKVLLTGAGVMTASLTFGLSSPQMAKAAVVEDRLDGTLLHADELYEGNKMRDTLTYLEQYRDSTDAELLWRLARICYKVGKYHSSGQEESRQLSERGLKYAERAVAADPDHFACHKWMGILINYSCEFEGYKRKIERSFEIKEYFKKAIELNPTDATCRHLLGQWCYGVSSVPWYQRKLATMIFATPPSSDFEEALNHFQSAEQIDPGFYSPNWLYIGKTLLQLGRVEEAGTWLRKAANYESEIGDDIEAKEEAVALLRRVGLALN